MQLKTKQKDKTNSTTNAEHRTYMYTHIHTYMLLDDVGSAGIYVYVYGTNSLQAWRERSTSMAGMVHKHGGNCL